MEDKNYLSHHGIKGQKHGVRRWQYEDGSLTPEGRIHYGYGEEREHSNKYDIKALKAETKARIRYEKAQQKMNAKLEKVKKAEKDRKAKERAEESKKKAAEKAAQHAREVAEQKKQLEEFKKNHPLKYKQLKKYLTKEGVLNDAGKALFFGNGERKQISDMSNKDLEESARRFQLEANYKQAYRNLENMSPSAKKKFIRIAKQSGAKFATQLAGKTLVNFVLNRSDSSKLGETFVNDSLESLRSAIDVAGYATTSAFDLGSGNIFKVDTRTPQQKIADNVTREVENIMSNAQFRSSVNSQIAALAAQAGESGNIELQRQYQNYLNNQNNKKNGNKKP